RQLRLHLTEQLLGPLALAQIEYESHTLIAAVLEPRGADQHRDATAILPKIIALKRPRHSGDLDVLERLRSPLAPFRRDQLRPAHPARNEIVPGESQHAEKGIIGFDDPTLEVKDHDSDNVGVDQAPDPSF